eukprot:m.60693 g.60693  ORF g.60693 m.60693 type:complete len:529 (-) comp13679_c0_seq1:89-1675(-)
MAEAPTLGSVLDAALKVTAELASSALPPHSDHMLGPQSLVQQIAVARQKIAAARQTLSEHRANVESSADAHQLPFTNKDRLNKRAELTTRHDMLADCEYRLQQAVWGSELSQERVAGELQRICTTLGIDYVLTRPNIFLSKYTFFVEICLAAESSATPAHPVEACTVYLADLPEEKDAHMLSLLSSGKFDEFKACLKAIMDLNECWSHTEQHRDVCNAIHTFEVDLAAASNSELTHHPLKDVLMQGHGLVRPHCGGVNPCVVFFASAPTIWKASLAQQLGMSLADNIANIIRQGGVWMEMVPEIGGPNQTLAIKPTFVRADAALGTAVFDDSVARSSNPLVVALRLSRPIVVPLSIFEELCALSLSFSMGVTGVPLQSLYMSQSSLGKAIGQHQGLRVWFAANCAPLTGVVIHRVLVSSASSVLAILEILRQLLVFEALCESCVDHNDQEFAGEVEVDMAGSFLLTVTALNPTSKRLLSVVVSVGSGGSITAKQMAASSGETTRSDTELSLLLTETMSIPALVRCLSS